MSLEVCPICLDVVGSCYVTLCSICKNKKYHIMCFDKIMNNMVKKKRNYISCPTCRMMYYCWENRVVKVADEDGKWKFNYNFEIRKLEDCVVKTTSMK